VGCGPGEYCPDSCLTCPCVATCQPRPDAGTTCGTTLCLPGEVCVVPCCGGPFVPDAGACTPAPPHCVTPPAACAPVPSCPGTGPVGGCFGANDPCQSGFCFMFSAGQVQCVCG